MCGSRTAGTRRTLTLRSEAAASARAPGSAIPHFPPAAALGPPSRAFSFVGPRPSSPVSVQSSRQVVGHEHGTQLAQAEGAGAAAQRRAVQDDARARGGGDGGRGIGGHGAEDALEDGGPPQLESQPRGGWRAAQYRGHARTLQADDGVNHALGHLRKDKLVSGSRRSQLPRAARPRPARAHLVVPEARLQRAPRCQEVSDTQVAGACLLEPHWAARPQGRVESSQRLLYPKAHGERKE